MKNERIRNAAKNADVHLWEVAEYIGVTDCTFSKKLRRELPADLQREILAAIKEIAKQKAVQAG